jgi:hypothetical protein
VLRGIAFASPALRLGQVTSNDDDYDHIAREYLGRSDGVLFREPGPARDVDWKLPPHPSFMWATERLCEYLGGADDAVLAALRAYAQAPHAPTGA